MFNILYYIIMETSLYNLKNNEERKIFYIGNLLNKNINDIPLSSDPTIKFDNDFRNNSYNKPLKNLLVKTNNYGKKLNYVFGDNSSWRNPTVLVKTRGGDFSNSGVILRFLFNRHWGNYYNKPPDIPFDEKRNIIFWRGTTTGRVTNIGNRFDLVTKYYNKHPNIDVGFSKICQRKDSFTKYVKGNVSISEMLNYKYIISVEGNDKDSGINWKLNSNSLILMPKPRITSWLMETTLVANFHYVLLKDDFSDLQEKYEWCEKNQDKCKEIIKNANYFMSQFLDNEKEEQIEIDVINTYFDILSSKQK
jgi:hypothetical protein